jgi:Na+/H+ antiporter NhaC
MLTQPNAPRPNPKALIPFLVFLLFYLGISLWTSDFYAIPMPIAFLVAAASAFTLNRKAKLSEKVELFAKGMGECDIMIMCLIFVLAGAFAATAQAAGSVDATVLICRHLIPDQFLIPGFFLISCLISLAIGTSCGTIAAVMPIAAGLIQSMNLDAALMAGAVIGGAMFGDNMSMISDTTIAATRTQGIAMREKFLTNIQIALPTTVVTLCIYFFVGKNTQLPPVLSDISFKDILATLPYLLILAGALSGFNVMALLFLGALLSVFTGHFVGDIAIRDLLTSSGRGIQSMADTLIIAILAGGLLHMIRSNGGIAYLMTKIERFVTSKWKCELGITALVGCVNLFTANNTVAIVIAGPIAKELSQKYGCNARRIASILDAASCTVQGLIPYGAQLLIAIGILNSCHISLSAFKLIGALYYPILLGFALIISILLNGRRK